MAAVAAASAAAAAAATATAASDLALAAAAAAEDDENRSRRRGCRMADSSSSSTLMEFQTATDAERGGPMAAAGFLSASAGASPTRWEGEGGFRPNRLLRNVMKDFFLHWRIGRKEGMN